MTARISRKQKRALREEGILGENISSNRFQMKKISPLTYNQSVTFRAWKEQYHLMLHGIAGTGKTFLAMYFALTDVLDQNSPYKTLYIIRSTVPTRDQGFLPGNQKQKEAVYEDVYVEASTELFGRGDAYNILKQKNAVQFRSTSFLRGLTLRNCVVIVDEMQNMSDQELHTVMTRVGENCKIIFCGDVKQDDLTSDRKKELSGLRNFMKIIKNMVGFKFIEFLPQDIVRSDIVKEYIIERDRLGL